MIFPLSDDDRHLLKPAWVTIGLLLVNIALYFYQAGHESFTEGWSIVPREITTGVDLVGTVALGAGHGPDIVLTAGPKPVFLTLLSGMFLHGSLMHLGGMLYLWFC
ncbi:MAG: hypothetical protein R3F31_03575 [Verrucomicrobiales bacterium]